MIKIANSSESFINIFSPGLVVWHGFPQIFLKKKPCEKWLLIPFYRLR